MTAAAGDAVLDRLRALGVVPVIVLDDPADAGDLAHALAGGGLPCAEITFRTAGAGEALRRIAAEHPDVLAGAGTVLTVAQAAEARAAGARFVVAPGLNPAVVAYCQEHALPVHPGVCTPTEVEAALALGVRALKFFPAEPAGGVPFLAALASPYPMIEFIPTGGIHAGNLAAYLALPNVAACGGSWMAPAAWLRERRFERVRAEAARIVAAVAAARADPRA